MTYSDGSSDEVEVDVTVTDNRSDADKYEPTVEGEKVEIGGKVDLKITLLTYQRYHKEQQ